MSIESVTEKLFNALDNIREAISNMDDLHEDIDNDLIDFWDEVINETSEIQTQLETLLADINETFNPE